MTAGLPIRGLRNETVHPEEVAGLLCVEAPVMLGEVLREVIAYTPEAMAQGSMWGGSPDKLITRIRALSLQTQGAPA